MLKALVAINSLSLPPSVFYDSSIFSFISSDEALVHMSIKQNLWTSRYSGGSVNSSPSMSCSVRYIKEHSAMVGQIINVLGRPVRLVRILSANSSQKFLTRITGSTWYLMFSRLGERPITAGSLVDSLLTTLSLTSCVAVAVVASTWTFSGIRLHKSPI